MRKLFAILRASRGQIDQYVPESKVLQMGNYRVTSNTMSRARQGSKVMKQKSTNLSGFLI